jgi:hypothetical protein
MRRRSFGSAVGERERHGRAIEQRTTMLAGVSHDLRIWVDIHQVANQRHIFVTYSSHVNLKFAA